MEDQPGGDPGHHHHEVPDYRQPSKQAENRYFRQNIMSALRFGPVIFHNLAKWFGSKDRDGIKHFIKYEAKYTISREKSC